MTAMRVTIVSAVYPPEPLTTGLTSDDLAAEIARRGHDVTVIAPFPNRPTGAFYPGHERAVLRIRRLSPGITAINTWHTLSQSSSLKSRFVENISFGVTSSVFLACAHRPDVIYLNTWPVFSQNLNGIVAAVRGVPLVCSVQDIYPETLINKAKLVESGVVARITRGLDCRFLRRCSRVVTISEGMRRFLIAKRDICADKVTTVPNWMPASRFDSELPRNGAFRKAHGISSSAFLAVFAGTLTMSAGVGLFIDAAQILVDDSRILILMVGDGTQRRWAESEISRRKLDNIRVVHPLRSEDVPEVQAAADVLLLSLTGEASQTAAPSKQIAYMLSGRPTLASVTEGSPPAELIRAANAGVVLPPDDSAALARCLRDCATNAYDLQSMGRQARAYAELNLSREALLPRLADLVLQACAPFGAGQRP